MNQSDMMTLGDPRDGDRGRFRVLPGFGGIALFDAEFRSFVFAPHTHETLMLGFIWHGRKRFRAAKAVHDVAAGGLSIVNPGDTHTGGVLGTDQLLRYTAVYPSAELLAEAGLPAGADLRPSVIEEPRLNALFSRALAPTADAAEVEESLLIALSGVASRFAQSPAPPERAHSRAVRRAVEYIVSDIAAEHRLENIAGVAAISPRHLIRSFRGSIGMTPQEFVRQERVRQAAARLRRGEATAQVAHLVGFADQPHMTRAFRKVMGTTPAAYARSWQSV